jgi:phosphoglycolate phosphatase
MRLGMSDFPFRIIGFDLDGTLVDTAADLLVAANHALALADIAPLTREQIVTVIGGGARKMLALGIELAGAGPPADAQFETMFVAMLAHYERHIADHSRPFPGALEMCDILDTMGVKYGVVTNKSERLARSLLKKLEMADRMASIIGGDTLPTRKPDPAGLLAMQSLCGGGPMAFIGDSHFDIDAAKAAGMASVACSFGYMMQPVETLGADAVIDHFDALIPVLLELG